MLNILLITHEGIGSALVNTAKATLGKLSCNIMAVDVAYNEDPDDILHRIQQEIKPWHNQEILVLSDLYGATPHNIAQKITENQSNRREISGVNLPMLFRILNYAELPLHELCEKALSGGREGIIDCKNEGK